MTFDQAQLSASTSFTPLPTGLAKELRQLCSLLHYAQHSFFINPLWDPLRDLITHPLSLTDIREMSGLANELSDRTRAVLREWELAHAGSGH